MSVWKAQAGKWTAKFVHEGRQHKKEGFPTRAKALDWEAAEKRRLKAPPPPTTHSISIGGLATRYLEHCRARMQKNTWRAKSHYYSALIAYLQRDPPADTLNKMTLLDFLENVREAEGEKNANRHLKDLKAMYQWAIMHDLVDKNPCKTIEPFPEQKAAKYVPPAEDIDRVLMVADQEEMDLLVCLYHTGGRIGEIFRLAWDDVNFEKRWIRLWTRKRRRGELEEDKLAMSDTLHNVLRRRWESRDKSTNFVFADQDGQALKFDSKRNMMRRLCVKAGVKEFGFHAIRHHVASIIADSGKATLGQVQRFLRHRRASTTETYLHELTRDQVEVAKILDGESVPVSVPDECEKAHCTDY